MIIDLEINPKVREIIATAIARAQPFWVGLYDQSGLEPVSRLSTYFERRDDGVLVNTADMKWGFMRSMWLHGAVIARAATGPFIVNGPFRSGAICPAPGDFVVIPAGGISVFGELP